MDSVFIFLTKSEVERCKTYALTPKGEQVLHLQRPVRPGRYEFIQGQPQQYTSIIDKSGLLRCARSDMHIERH